MTIWDDAKEEASEQLKHAKERQVQLEQQLLIRGEYVTDLKNKVRARILPSKGDLTRKFCPLNMLSDAA